MTKPMPGDYFVVRTTGIAARLIQIGTWSKWNHAGIYLGDGVIIEARPTGVSLANITKYNNCKIIWSTGVDAPFTEAETEELRSFALHFVGFKYGLWSIVALGLKCLGVSLFPAIKRAEDENGVICSQLVAWIWSHMGRKVSHKQHALVRPKDLALRLSRKRTTRSN